MPHRVPKGREGNEEKARDPAELQRLLDAFTPDYDLHRYRNTRYQLTDGVKFLADSVGAYSLIDTLLAWQKRARKDPRLREAQRWVLEVAKNSGVLHCYADDDLSFSVRLPFTDFPLPTVTIHIKDDSFLLPSELGATDA